MKKNIFALVYLGFATFACESRAASDVYLKQHDLLVAAIRNGQASGVMEGSVGELFTRQFRSTGTLRVEAKVIKSFKRIDCKRIEITFTKKDVQSSLGLTDAILKNEMNYCLDGTPPISVE